MDRNACIKEAEESLGVARSLLRAATTELNEADTHSQAYDAFQRLMGKAADVRYWLGKLELYKQEEEEFKRQLNEKMRKHLNIEQS